ncbi:MAG TPA: hypothetical protein PL033_17135 [Candidatus Brocadiia bacterium]|nr:hypothetical protein [Candidatus Brocadiia bacterium]
MPSVIFTFDHEDFLVPGSIDTAVQLAEALTRRGLRGSFCTVGLRAKFMQRLATPRQIATFEPHEIGFHSRSHGIKPVIAEELSKTGWDEGAELFIQREREGMEWVMETFRRDHLPVTLPPGYCDTAANGVWASARLGFRLVAGSPLVWNKRGVHHCAGCMHVRYSLWLDDFATGATFEEKRRQLERLLETEEYVLICDHPTYLYNAEWPEVGQAHLPPEEWKIPPPRPRETLEYALANIEKIYEFCANEPSIEVITYDELIQRESLERPKSLPREAVIQLARELALENTIRGAAVGGVPLSAAEVMAMMTHVLARPEKPIVPVRQLLGPKGLPGLPERDVPADGASPGILARAAEAQLAGEFMPDRLAFGKADATPGGWFRYAAQALADNEMSAIPASSPFPTEADAEDFRRNWYGWCMFPPDMSADRLMTMNRLQSWSFRPNRIE